MRMRRRGHSVLELMVAVSIGAVVIGLGAMMGFRHQRFHRDIVIAVERSEQLDQLVALMPISLRSIVAGEGDIAAGAARDTSLEFRATTASAVICDSDSGTIVLAPTGASPTLAAILSRPEPGDTAWFLDTSTAIERWTPRAIVSVSDAAVICTIGSARPHGDALRPTMILRVASPPPPAARVVRVTRPWRYSLYRASDGGWYLGAKEWNTARARFNSIQPVAGPVVSAAAGGLRFSYLDSAGAPLAAGTDQTTSIAAIEIAFRVDSVIPGNHSHAATIRSQARAVVALRSRTR